ncbi:MAG: phosphoenolpyruvate synthase [Chloroflexi bacterium]|nr:phosphoenolpyruvate synthase [Chloroflexota bacterium]
MPTPRGEHAPFVAPLDAFGRADVDRAGGKGANLGELIRAGFPVPPGFVLTTAAYDRFVTEAGLDQRIRVALSETNDGGASALREAFTTATLPDDVATVVVAGYRALGGGSVAVRSSATGEDLPSATFAGQQETFLGVIGEDALMDAIRGCWASLWSERAIAYRRAHGVDDATVKLAVVVQRLVSADVAGVLFTANPITGARDEVVVDASPGLGEAVAGGLVTPDHYVVNKPNLEIRARTAGRREVVIRARDGGGTERTRPAAADGAAALADEDIRQLVRLGIAIEEHYGAPQDVEWARAGGRTFIVQARPITALLPSPVSSSRVASVPRLLSPRSLFSGLTPPRAAVPTLRRPSRIPNFAGEIFPIRPYPLDLTTHIPVALRAVGDAMARPLGIAFPTVERSIMVQDGVALRLTGFTPRPTWRTLYRPLLSLWQRRRVDLARWHDDVIVARAVQQAHALEERDLSALSWDEVLRTLHEALALIMFVAQLRHRYFPQAVRNVVLLWLLLRLAGRQDQYGVLVSGVENKTLELNRALERLAGTIRSSDALRHLFAETEAASLPTALAAAPEARPFLAALQTFLRDYGHRESMVSMMSQPTWKDAPEIPLGILKALAAAEPPTAPAGPAEWERARDVLLARSLLGRPPLRKIFLRLLVGARHFGHVREDTHFYLTLPMPAERRCALELGRRLVDAGVLERAEDVFHLTLAELEEAGQPWPPTADMVRRLAVKVADRKARRAALAGQPFAEPVVPSSGTSERALVAGLPASPGIAEGPVCIVHGPDEFGKLQPGDVLVASFTNPAWTPLFPRAAAVIADTGGPISHAAIVAREYGVPAVLGTGSGTTALVDGQRVRVDGTRGQVFAVEPREEGTRCRRSYREPS